MPFKIQSPYRPTGDQPEAIKEICEAVNAGADAVTLPSRRSARQSMPVRTP